MILQEAKKTKEEIIELGCLISLNSPNEVNLEAKEFISWMYTTLSTIALDEKYTIDSKCVSDLYYHYCKNNNVYKTALLAIPHILNTDNVFETWGEGHNKKQKTGVMGAIIKIDGNEYFCSVRVIRNHLRKITPYSINLSSLTKNETNNNDAVHNDTNDSPTFGNNHFGNDVTSQRKNVLNSLATNIRKNNKTDKNESKNMTKKNTIRLTESELSQIITESVKQILSANEEVLDESWLNNIRDTYNDIVTSRVNPEKYQRYRQNRNYQDATNAQQQGNNLSASQRGAIRRGDEKLAQRKANSQRMVDRARSEYVDTENGRSNPYRTDATARNTQRTRNTYQTYQKRNNNIQGNNNPY